MGRYFLNRIKMLCGGHSKAKTPDQEEIEIANGHKSDAEKQLGTTFSEWKVESCTTQVVAGTNFTFCVACGNNQKVVLKVFRPLPHTGDPTELTGAEMKDG